MTPTGQANQTVLDSQAARRRALGVATPVYLAGFSVLAGGFSGILAAAAALSPAFLRNPLGTSIFSFGFGCFVGTLCSPIPASILRHRPFFPACCVTLGVAAPLVMIVAMVSPTLSRLMFLSGTTFCLAALAARLALPRIWLDEGLCWRCGYDLRGSQEVGRCPECATPILPHEGPCLPAVEIRSVPLARPPLSVYSLGVLLALAFAATMLGAAWIERRPRAFDGTEWKSGPATSRLPMARDLVAREALLGLTEADVVRLLGVPTSRLDRTQYSLGGRATFNVTYGDNEIVQSARGSALPRDIIDEQFDAGLWSTGTTHERLRMARSLSTHRSDILARLSRSQVHALLGPPDDRRVSLSYTVGLGRAVAASSRQQLLRSLMMDKAPRRLVLTLGDGKVARTYLPVDS